MMIQLSSQKNTLLLMDSLALDSSYFVPLFSKPVLVDAPGEYVTRSGEKVTVQKVSTAHNFGCRGTYANGAHERWHKSGCLFSSWPSPHDLVSRA